MSFSSSRGPTLIEVLVVFIIGGVFFGIIGLGALFGFGYYAHAGSWDVTAKIHVQPQQIDGTEVFYLQTTDPNTGNIIEPGNFRIGDDPFVWNLNSLDLLAEAKAHEGQICEVQGKGRRSRLLSWIPWLHKILNCRPA